MSHYRAYLGYQGHSQSYLDQGGNFVGHTKFNATNLVFKAMIFFWLNFTDDQLSILLFVLVKISSNYCLLHNKFDLCAAERPTANFQVGASCVICASVCLVPACFLLDMKMLLDRCLLWNILREAIVINHEVKLGKISRQGSRKYQKFPNTNFECLHMGKGIKSS